MVTQVRERPVWVRLVVNNLGLKLAAIALSLLLFSLVHSDVDAQRSLFVDVVSLLPPPESTRMLVSELPSQVKVTLQGSRSRLNGLSREDFSPIQLDLRQGSNGYYYFRPEDVDVSGGVRVVTIEPSVVPLKWAETAHKEIRIVPRVEGKIGEHQRLVNEVRSRPATARVRGPKAVLEELTAITTDAIALTGLPLGHHSIRVALAPLPKLVAYEHDAYVELELDIAPIVSERTLRRLEVAVLGEAPGALRPDRVAVTLRGPQEVLNEIEPEHVVPYIELGPDDSRSLVARDVKLRGVPEVLEVVRITPPSVLARAAQEKGTR